MTPRTALRLGRVSNLPTVWTNAAAGAALAAGAPDVGRLAAAALALTLVYVGGMWLNDAFDAEIDARERNDRPIPAGQASRRMVFVVGGGLLAAGTAVAALAGAGAAGVALAATVLLYDWTHKRTALSPVVMGAARFAAYAVGAAAAVGGDLWSAGLWMLGGAGLFAHVVGLTYAAKGEASDSLGAAWPLAVLAAPVAIAGAMAASAAAAVGLAATTGLATAAVLALRRLRRRARGDVPRAVVTMIAAICLYDAALIAAAGLPVLAVVAAAGFPLTLALQRVASGT